MFSRLVRAGRLMIHFDRRTVIALTTLLALDLALFGDALFSRASTIPSSPIGDAGRYFAPVRDFAYAEMARGNVPLWNPYIFSGSPFLAACQPALFYPLNLHYFVLPMAKAICVEIALHMYLIGVFTFLWARFWKVPHPAAVFAGAVMMLCGPYVLHVFAGHLSLLSSWAWSPLAFFAVDAYLESRRLRHAFTGAAAMTMAFMAGHPQGFFETGLVLGLYVLLRLVSQRKRFHAVPGLALLFLAPAFLAAVQLWPAIHVSAETTRSGGLSYKLASSYSFPPENMLTFFAPLVFGDTQHRPYWGAWLFWEMSGFVGITTIALAGYGALRSPKVVRRNWLILLVIVFILALGRNTPVFGLLWAYLPGFSLFRSLSRFLIFGAMFTAMLAGLGAGELLGKAQRVRPIVLAAAIASLVLVVLAVSVRYSFATGAWLDVLESFQPKWQASQRFPDGFPYQSAAGAATSLLIAAATCAVLAALFALAPRGRGGRIAVLVFGVLELAVFARATRASLDLSTLNDDRLDRTLSGLPNDYRVCDRPITNQLMFQRTKNVWGYDPVILRRYQELLSATQGLRAEEMTNEFNIRKSNKLFAMFCCAYMLDSRTTSTRPPRALRDPLPRFSFPRHARIVADKEERLAILLQDNFDPRDTVILEKDPVPGPSGEVSHGTVAVLEESTDAVTLDISVEQDAILLMADSYDSSWTIAPVVPGPQPQYSILPANHALRAVPLARGHHVIRLVYAPLAYRVGIWVSTVSVLVFSASWLIALRSKKNEMTPVAY